LQGVADAIVREIFVDDAAKRDDKDKEVVLPFPVAGGHIALFQLIASYASECV
jgi:hypothetical protein